MSLLVAAHPTPDQLRAFGEGRLASADFASVEDHLSSCASCCRALEHLQPDSFVGRLRSAERAAFATTANGAAATLIDPAEVPPELANHPRYRVLGLVGQGGMGAVYKAEHRRMQRPVALKVINPGLMRNPTTVSRFQQEVRAAAQLAHPNIVSAYDADEAGGLHFLVMEYVEGKTLAECGPLTMAQACDCVRQAALGLQHLHEAGLIHRDIKPHNLMRTPAGVVKLLDCGLARFASDPADSLSESEIPNPQSAIGLTAAGTVMGTADYVAPEQVADARAADIRSDIYSLGCTLYHLLTGKPPFPDGAPADKFRHHAETPVPIPQEWPDALKAVVGKMTAKDPAARYGTPAEAAEALGRAGAAIARGEPTPRRSRSRLAAVVLSLAALIVAAVVLIRIRTDDGREIVVQTDDPAIEIVAKDDGRIVRIRDPKSGQTWELDTKKLTLRDLEHPEGLALEVPWRGKVTFKSRGGKVIVTAGPADVPVAVAPDFRPLFNGKDLAGWNAEKAQWVVKDGVLIADRGGEIASKSEVSKHFRLRAEVKLKCGTGVFRFRLPADGETDWNVALMDNRLGFVDGQIHTGRGLGQVSTELIKNIATIDEWMVLEIIAVDREASVRINGKQVMYLHGEKCTPAPGRIGLWIRDGQEPGETEVHVRKIEVMDLAGRSPPESGFRPLFNGKDLAGWTSLADSYFVKKDGSLLANPVANDYGMLRTVAAFENYELRLQCRLAGHGNAGSKTRAGLAFHVTNADPDPMKARYGVTLVITSGRDWGMTARGRGDVGEITSAEATRAPAEGGWHDVRVLSQDGRITIFFNGEERWSCSRCPDYKGRIGLWAEDGEVTFRNIEIRELPAQPIRASGPVELAKLPNAADALKHEDLSETARAYLGGGDAKKAPKEVVAVLGERPGADKKARHKILALAWSPDGRKLAAGDSAGKLTVWDVARQKPGDTLDFGGRGVRRVVFSADGRLLVTLHDEGRANNSVVDVWAAEGLEHVAALKTRPGQRVHALAVSSDAGVIATANLDRTVSLWQRDGDKSLWDEAFVLPHGERDEDRASLLAFSPDGTELVTVTSEFIRVWGVKDGKRVDQWWEAAHVTQHVEWLPGGRIGLVSSLGDAEHGEWLQSEAWNRRASKDAFRVIREGTRVAAPLDVHDVGPVCRLVAYASPGHPMVLWQPVAKGGLRFFDTLPPASAARFSPDGRYLAVGDKAGVVSILRLAERGHLPQLSLTAVHGAAPAAPEILPPPREQPPPKKSPGKPLEFAVKFPDNLFLVRARMKEIDKRGPFGAPAKYRFEVEQVFAGPANVKGKKFTYIPTPFFGSGPINPAMLEKQLFAEMNAGNEMLWWIRRAAFGPAVPTGEKDVADEEFVPIVNLKELEYHAIETFPFLNTPLGSAMFSAQSWAEGLDWARQAERVYHAKTAVERGRLLHDLVARGRPPVARWALAMLCNAASAELRNELRERAERDTLSCEDALLIDRMLCRIEGVKWFAELAREDLLRSGFSERQIERLSEFAGTPREQLLRECLSTSADADFDLACRRVADAVHDHEITFTLFAKLLDPVWRRGAKLSEEKQWSLGRMLLSARFEIELVPAVSVAPPKPKPYGLMTAEERGRAFAWLLGIAENSTSSVLHLHAAAALKNIRPFSADETRRLTAVLSQQERGSESRRELEVLLAPAPTQEDEDVARRTAHFFGQDYATKKEQFVLAPFCTGGWLVPREKGWELPVAVTSTDAIKRLKAIVPILPTQVVAAEFLDLRPGLTRDPVLKELAGTILKEKGYFYAVTLRGRDEVSLLIRVQNGLGAVRGMMPVPPLEPDPLETAVRATVAEFIKAHHAKDDTRLKDLVSTSWCFGGTFSTVIDRKTERKLLPNPSFGRFPGNAANGHPGYGPPFPEKLPETIAHATTYARQRLALLGSDKDVRELDNFMGERGYVVFLGKPREPGGITLLVRIDKDAATKKDRIKVVGTLTGLE
jgi:WD40 repeat protein